jgi:hypothetical protein
MALSLTEYRLDQLRIDVSSRLGEGGAAEVHRCKTADGDRVVLKRYTEEGLKGLDAAALRDLIDWPARIGVEARDKLMAMSAWPRAVVVNGPDVIGVLMDEAPTKFFRTRDGELRPRHFSIVAVRKEQAEKRGYPYYDFPQKIARLGHLLEELQFLHSNDIVVGDLQTNNILTTSPEPDSTGVVTTENFMLDCDSFIVNGRAAFPPMDPINTRPPYPVEGHSAITDLYKLALLTIRCLSENLAADTIQYEKFSHILPTGDFVKLAKLLTEPNPGLTATDLANMARAWQSTVRKNGKLFYRDDAALFGPWTEEKRQLHLAGIKPVAAASTGGVSTPPSVPGEPGSTKEILGTPSQRQPRSKNKRILAAVFAILLVGIVGAVIATNMQHSSSSSSYASSSTSTYPTTTGYPSTYPTTTWSPTPTTTVHNSAQILRTARVGACLHIDEGPRDSRGHSDITNIDWATCGTTYANVRVVSTDVSNPESCRGEAISDPNPPPYIACVVRQ